MPANAALACSTTGLAGVPAKALLPAGATLAGQARLSKRLFSIDDTAPLKSIKVRSVMPNAVGSSTATRLPATTKGAPLALIVAPASVLKVNSQLPPTKLTVSLTPTRSIAPMTREPITLVSVSGPPRNWIASPLLPPLMTP